MTLQARNFNSKVPRDNDLKLKQSGPEIIKKFMLSSDEHENLNAYKYENIKNFFFIFQAQISLECYFLLINVKMPTIVGILIFMSRKIHAQLS